MAKKKNRGSKAIRARIRAKKRDRKSTVSARERLKERITSDPDRILQIDGNDGQRKLSEILIEFAEPLIDKAVSTDEKHKALKFAILTWNASFLSPEQLEAFCVESDIPEETVKLFQYYILRKRTLFKKEKRKIVDFEITETSRGTHLYVASAD